MGHFKSLLLLLCYLQVTTHFHLVVASSDEIIDLPGLPSKSPFKHYSGYLRASETRYLHYWFVESQSSPDNDPLVLWLNGGPGCSSMEGLLNEHGPYLVTEKGDLRYNSQSWNKIANVLYLESPAGVGYSYATDGNIVSTDDTAAEQNYNALMEFFKKYPKYVNHDFFISGESYGGVYVPTLARQVMKNQTIKLQGILVGNGLSSYTINDNSLLYFGQYHGLLGENLWHDMLTKCCSENNTEFCMFTTVTKASCRAVVQKAVDIIGYGLNVYNLYAPCYGGVSTYSDKSFLRSKDLALKKNRFTYLDVGANLFRGLPEVQRKHALKSQLRQAYGVKLDPPCTNSTAISDYLNSPAVRAAIHIPDNLPEWSVCSDDVSSLYQRNYDDMYSVYRDLLKPQKYRILIFNGDVDMACNFLGDEWFFDSMEMEVVEQRRPWYFQDPKDYGSRQIGGFTKSWKTGVVYTTVLGAGHMVPQDKPEQAFAMYSRFIKGIPL
jgi:cathepsin A (carboxypeptidase C)